VIVAFDTTPGLISPAGIGRYAQQVAGALDARADVTLRRVAAARRAPQGRAERVVQGLVREALYYPFGLAARARSHDADLVHCPAPYWPRVPDRPLVVSVHDLLALENPELFTRAMVAQIRLTAVAFLRRADRVLVGSTYTKEAVASLVGYPADRIDVTPYGVDARFRPVTAESDRLHRRFGIAAPYVLCVGTLEPRKNLVAAVRAFRHVIRAIPEATLVIAGSQGWRNASFEHELQHSSGEVVLTGRVGDEELVQLYAGASGFLFPSLFEGFGFPVLEAMACGTPVISSNTTSLPELVGDAGLLVAPDDLYSMASAVIRVLEDAELAADLRRRGLARAERFSWDGCAAATVDSYRRAVGG
jgi:glycosyltransferase involved in cell wall biosynthesis